MKKILLFVSIMIMSSVAAYTVYASDYGMVKTADTAKLTKTGSLPDIIGNVVGNLLTMVGVLFLVLMIYGGITWMLSRGNEEQAHKSLNTITAAVIGLVIVVASYAITSFVFESVNESPAGQSECFDTVPLGAGCVANVCESNASEDACVANPCCSWL